VEDKRSVLYDLRNFESEAASRIAVPALLDLNEVVRATATRTVIYLPKNEAVKVLVPLLAEKSEFVRQETVYALGEIRNPDVADQLIVILQRDKKQSVRDAAAVSLGLLGDPAALQPLSNIISKKPKSSQQFLRRAAARSIGQIAESIQQKALTFETPESFLPTKYKQPGNLSHQDLVKENPALRPVIASLLKSLQNTKEFPDVKREVAFALGAFGNNSAVPILQANLNNEDYYLAEICREALLKINK
jgi:HEAT repeat protein